ncbi:isoleucyl-tRNA synthetase [Anseongella ginsenosidimutans]|uniref:Isoleucine--tRNA ligase n=1 Tax=Anseongella ginsenosidimutans TaxID=496056 RepID=A0A4R3KWV8_9SPHI|nr:isoleucine--tRNA ligase [Anseongella ginsenosidimutans]QEC51202.1 isoleucine--tRNA ligase [Anseongella ginsenosidimutans]TCS90125.1 isoleucyl-tRNA synthetase [Anseongella ginsenosidimutans]
MPYKEYRLLDLPGVGKEVLAYWEKNGIFEQSIRSRPEDKSFTFYEGPPSANGIPGIHHVMARAIKDIFCRYKTLRGFRVERKGGWDTHGLPIELAVEKALGITKEDIGVKLSVEEYNQACRKEVMKYTDVWNDLTRKMGYWVDLDNPYITYENKYIETLWYLLKELHRKNYLYKGYTVQPYSPAAGTGLSSHELNQPGTYKMVKDTTVVAQFKLKYEDISSWLFESAEEPVYFLAWTTTPWTLPSNCALAVGRKIGYVKVKTVNPYTNLPVSVILARDLLGSFFRKEDEGVPEEYRPGDKHIPWQQAAGFSGEQLLGIHYEQLLPYVSSPELEEHAFRVIPGDFVTTEDGTGIVHTASVFGADDFRVCRENGVPSVMVRDENGKEAPLVTRQGKFVKEVVDFAGMYVREEFYTAEERHAPGFKSTDVLIAIKLKEENKAFRVEKYEHSYPHCWRTDKPVLYYPLDSWFIRTTGSRERMVELNKQINWKPASTGTGRFGNWLENLVDWNLSRSRFWGTPLPIWRSEDESEEICIGSVAELKEELQKANGSGLLNEEEVKRNKEYLQKLGNGDFDLHRPYVDGIVLKGEGGNKLYRETDLIDVWFDSGSMPYAQWHYPFENKELFSKNFPADFIAEGVDQTRGWFFTLHAIAVMLFDSVAFKNVVSNGLVLDKKGNKMSKRHGNAVDPFETIEKYGADVTRWYMISNASPWDNLKFNMEGLGEVQRKFFGTLFNTYAFFALYANIDGFVYKEEEIPAADRPEIDRWIISLLNSLTEKVDGYYKDYEPTKAARAIQEFVDEHLSNWYVRLCRRRFWKGDYTHDKISAYQTLYTCLESIAQLMSPIAPFYSDRLFMDLNEVTGRRNVNSVHLTMFPPANTALIDEALEERMQLAQDISSMILSLRKKADIRVRQPLRKVLLPVLNESFREQADKVKDLILSETNVREIEYVYDTTGILVKKARPDFKKLGPKAGKQMKEVAEAISSFSKEDISRLENDGYIELVLSDRTFTVDLDEVTISSEDIPGWQVASSGGLTVALDITITEELKNEGIARELVNRIQNLRKEKGFEVTDRITVKLEEAELVKTAVKNNLAYICAEILGDSLEWARKEQLNGDTIEMEDQDIRIEILKSHE